MLSFLLRRLIVAIPTLFVVVTVAFFMMRAAPGSPFEGDRKLPKEIEANIMAKYGMDKPLPVQYVNYVGGVLHGDFGPSLKYRDKSVLDIIAQNYQVSLKIGLAAFSIMVIVGVTLGVIAALGQVTASGLHRVCRSPSLAYASPASRHRAAASSWYSSSQLGQLPIKELERRGAAQPGDAGAGAGHPAQIAIISRLTRAEMIEALKSNYVRTAGAKGLPGVHHRGRHAIRAAVLPLVSYLGPAFASLMTLARWWWSASSHVPGLGKFFVNSALQRDGIRW